MSFVLNKSSYLCTKDWWNHSSLIEVAPIVNVMGFIPSFQVLETQIKPGLPERIRSEVHVNMRWEDSEKPFDIDNDYLRFTFQLHVSIV